VLSSHRRKAAPAGRQASRQQAGVTAGGSKQQPDGSGHRAQPHSWNEKCVSLLQLWRRRWQKPAHATDSTQGQHPP
jgi:hypothetical protein